MGDSITFKKLPIKWKSLVIIGIIATIACLGLIVFLVLLFKTDLIPFKIAEEATESDLEEYEELFNNFGNNYDMPNFSTVIKDLDGNNLLDLLYVKISN